MIEIGRASASQVVAAYRHDFVLRQKGIAWPETPQSPPLVLPVMRLVALHNAGRPVFWPLEAVWTLYEMSIDEILTLRSMWGDPSYAWKMRDLIGHIASGAYTPPAENQGNLADLKLRVQQGALP